MKRHTTRYRLFAALLALGIFLVDALSPLEGAVAVLYVIVVMLADQTARRGDILVAGAGSIVLTLVAYIMSHGAAHVGAPAVRALVSLAAICISTLLALRDQEAQDAVLAAHAELAHAARVATLGELTASIAHEVNQPLMAVVTSGEAGMRWLKRPSPDLHEVETALARVIAEAHRASEIVSRIRAFLAKAPAPRTMVSVPAIIEEATDLVQRELSREQVELRIELAPDLPLVKGDRIELQQVLVNLMINAGQAMARQPTPRVLSVEASRPGDDELAITVSDTGPGIAEDDLVRLFDPFFTTKADGMGMGLAICRRTMEAHGGRLLVQSAPGKGAQFQLTLPLSPDDRTS